MKIRDRKMKCLRCSNECNDTFCEQCKEEVENNYYKAKAKMLSEKLKTIADSIRKFESF